MADLAKTLEVLSSLEEQERAYKHFEAVHAVHNAAIQAFEVLPSLPDSDDIVAIALRVKDGLKSPDGDSYFRRAQRMSEAMAAERERGYQVIRGSALIAVCAAFEYLIKATFVSQAAYNPRAAAGLLANTKINMRAGDVLGMPETEQWFVIADALFTELAKSDPPMHSRVRRFLVDYTYLPERPTQLPAMTKALDGVVDDRKFDEAFLTRNCLVHNGGRVSTPLARFTKQPVGELIVFRDGVSPLLKPMAKLAGHLNSLWV